MKVIEPLPRDPESENKPLEPLAPLEAPPKEPPGAEPPATTVPPPQMPPGPPSSGPLDTIPHWEPPAEDSQDTRWTYAPYLLFFGATAGAFYYLLYNSVIKHFPHAIGLCTTSQGRITIACSGTLLSGVITATILFLFASMACKLLMRKSFVLPFLMGGLAVALFVFLELALLNDVNLLRVLTWLLTHHALNQWVIPAVIAGIVVAGVNAAIFYLKPKTKKLAMLASIGASIVILLFVPSLSDNFAAQQTNATLQSTHEQLIRKMQASDVPLYIPKDAQEPLKPTSFLTSMGSTIYFAPGYQVYYSFADPYPNQTGETSVFIRKATAAQFNPPTDCGENTLPLARTPASATHSPVPCTLLLTTPKGRLVYGYTPSWKFGLLHIDPASAAAKSVPPDTYYVLVGGILMSFNGPTANGRDDNIDTKTPLTTDVIQQFVDSLEPLQGDALARFARTYLKEGSPI